MKLNSKELEYIMKEPRGKILRRLTVNWYLHPVEGNGFHVYGVYKLWIKVLKIFPGSLFLLLGCMWYCGVKDFPQAVKSRFDPIQVYLEFPTEKEGAYTRMKKVWEGLDK